MPRIAACDELSEIGRRNVVRPARIEQDSFSSQVVVRIISIILEAVREKKSDEYCVK